MGSAETFAVGVDVGGTKIAAGVVTEDGRLLEKVRLPSPSDDAVRLREAIVEAVEKLRARHEVTAVGVGAAGFVTADRGGVYFAPNLVWGNEPLADLLEEALHLPVVVENDGNAAAWAEFCFGAGDGVPDQLLLVIGTGVGGGMILGGDLYRGGHGVAGEVGHVGVVHEGRLCNCGRRGCLEEYASGSALQRRAREEAGGGRAPGLLGAAGGSVDQVTGALVTQLAHEGDADALRLFAELAEHLGRGVASLVAVLDPTLILLGGGVGDAGDLLLHPTREVLAREITGRGRRPAPEIRIAALGNDAGMIGAADLARRTPR